MLSADVFARYCRLRGYETLYICGTDEYGTAAETRARQEGIEPQALCDRYFAIHRDIYKWFEISFDHFGRSSHPVHTEITQNIFKKIHARGHTLSRETQQLYSEKMQIFLADRYVVGHCPHCGYEHARGDQCEHCGKLLDPTDLRNPKSILDGTPPVLRTTRHLYINLPRLLPQIETWLKESQASERWALNATRMTEAWLRDGLKARAITRDLSWGIPVPLESYRGKVFYVWFDAPIGYISITAQHTPEWRTWWQDPEQVKLYQFVGKDNIPFHTVIFPATLLGTGEPWCLVHHISSTEYLNYEGGQFSKSRGVGVFGTDAVNSGIPPDMWRFYLLYNRPERSDYNFMWDDFYQRINVELIGNLANLFNRFTSFVHKFYQGKIPPPKEEPARATEVKAHFKQQMQEAISDYQRYMERAEIRAALHRLCSISDFGNKLFQRYEPWKSPSSALTLQIVSLLTVIVRNLAVMLSPFMPHTAQQIGQQLAIDQELSWELLQQPPFQGAIGKPQPLFTPLEKQQIQELRQRYSPSDQSSPLKRSDSASALIQTFNTTVQLISARIEQVSTHPSADKLYVERLDDGSGNARQIVSGLAPYYRREELVDMNVIIVNNLQTATLRGVASQGMLLAVAGEEGVPIPLTVEAPPGTPVVLADERGNMPDIPTEVTPLSIKRFQSFPIEVVEHTVMVGERPLLCRGKALKVSAIARGKVS